jgi:hypothetical protein
VQDLTFSANVNGAAANTVGAFFTVSSTNLFECATNGTITDRGAHGAGDPSLFYDNLTCDGNLIYIGGSTKIRKYDTAAHTFADFSTAGGAKSVAFLNNTLFSASDNVLYSYDTAGTRTTLYTFKGADGTSSSAVKTIIRLLPYGGDLAVLVADGSTGQPNAEIYVWNGTGLARIAGFPDGYSATSMCLSNEILIIGGYERTASDVSSYRTVVYYYANGSLGILYADPVYQTAASGVTVAPYSSGVVISDASRSLYRYHNMSSGSISTIGAPSAIHSGSMGAMATNYFGQVFHVQEGTTAQELLFDISSYPSTYVVYSSLIDFDTALPKYVKGITVDWSGTGTMDIAYQLNDLDGAWTNLQTGAVAGTEYAVNQTARQIAVRITGNVNAGQPVLKRLYVRAVPILQTFRARTYNLDLTNTPNNQTLLQDGSIQPLTGHEQATNLITAITSATPISITDRFGTYTAVLEPGQCNVLELHSDSGGGGKPANSGQFVATIVAREV